tara:strand:+ start:3615 stop:4046 length:432 start_codon:yes stop_codon:yes gene_type:complete
MSVNKVILVGRVGREPEVREAGGTKVANIALATSERYKNKEGKPQEKTEWHRVTIWGALAGVVEKYVNKGSQLYIEGKNETRKWQDSDNKDRYTTEVVVNMTGTMKMLGGGNGQQENSGNAGGDDMGIPPAGVDEFQSDDIPF